MLVNIDEIVFTIFDIETTGLEPEAGDRIIEIAAIRIRQGKKGETFSSLVNPEKAVSQAAFEINHITSDMLKHAPKPKKILPNFLDFISGSCLSSYNLAFDLGFLSHEFKLLDRVLPLELQSIDILTMAKRLLPGLERYALWYVAQNLGIKTQQVHRALSDVELAIEVFNRLSSLVKEKGISTFLEFNSLFGQNPRTLNDINSAKLSRIQEALDLGVRLKIKYLSRLDAQISEREILPKQIKQDKNKNYLVGYCYLRNEERTFSIDGILHLEII
jgi:DNA polymerase III epsilon subunit family exonuclease